MTTMESGLAAAAGRKPSSLDRIFHPRSIAVAGVSPKPSIFAAVGLGFLIALKDRGFEPLYAVNPNYEEIGGVRCYPSVLDIDGPVDHVISSVPAHAVSGLIEDCIAKGVNSIHFFTAGFSETGDEEKAEMESQLVSRAIEGGIRVLGPNCMGLYVPSERISFNGGFPAEPGPVGFLSQSGGNAIDMVNTSAARGVRYSKMVSYGNAADIGESELLEYLADDPETEVIAAYVEGVRDGPRFFRAMRRAAAVKPVVVLKGGRTPSGNRAVMSHTASLAGSAEVFDALCRQVNAVRVSSVDEMADMAVAFQFVRQIPGPRIAVIGGGGGLSVFAADQIDESGLECPVLPENTQAALREFTPGAGTSIRNPVDSVAIFEPSKLERTLSVIATAKNVDVILLHMAMSWSPGRQAAISFAGVDPMQYVAMIADQLVCTRDNVRKPIVLVLRPPLDLQGMERTLAFQEKVCRAGFAVFPTIPRAATALHRLLRRQRAAIQA